MPLFALHEDEDPLTRFFRDNPPPADEIVLWNKAPEPAVRLAWPIGTTKGRKPSYHPFSLRPTKGLVFPPSGSLQVMASAEGAVVRVARMRGFGNYVIIEHPGNLLTVYGNLDRIRAKAGQQVTRGQVIGQLARQDKVGLQFQVGHNGQPVNPLKYIRDTY